jgi:hypothetical protein
MIVAELRHADIRKRIPEPALMSRLAPDWESLLPILREGDRAGGELSEVLAAAVVRKNRANALPFLRTPCAQRAALAPQCLRSTSACRAQARSGEYVCRGCGALEAVLP